MPLILVLIQTRMLLGGVSYSITTLQQSLRMNGSLGLCQGAILNIFRSPTPSPAPQSSFTNAARMLPYLIRWLFGTQSSFC